MHGYVHLDSSSPGYKKKKKISSLINVYFFEHFIWNSATDLHLESDIICSMMRTPFWERSSRKPVSFEEQICIYIYEHILAPNGGYCVYDPWNIFAKRGKMNDLLFPAWDVRVFCILWYNFKKKQTCPFICNRRVTLFHLKFYFKRTLIVLAGGFENWGLSVGCILGYSLVSTKAYSITRSI